MSSIFYSLVFYTPTFFLTDLHRIISEPGSGLGRDVFRNTARFISLCDQLKAENWQHGELFEQWSVISRGLSRFFMSNILSGLYRDLDIVDYARTAIDFTDTRVLDSLLDCPGSDDDVAFRFLLLGNREELSSIGLQFKKYADVINAHTGSRAGGWIDEFKSPGSVHMLREEPNIGTPDFSGVAHPGEDESHNALRTGYVFDLNADDPKWDLDMDILLYTDHD